MQTSSSQSQNIFHQKHGKFILFAIIPLVIVALLLVGFTVPIKSQTLISRALDTTGFSKQALGVDLINKNDNALLKDLSSVDPTKPDTCKPLWKSGNSLLKNNGLVSGKIQNTTYVVNPTYKDNFTSDIYGEGVIDLKNFETSGNFDIKANIDLDVIKKLIEETEKDSSSAPADLSKLKGKAKAQLQFESVVQSEGLFLKIPKLLIDSSLNKTDKSSSDWYKNDFKLNNTQKDGLKELGPLLQELLLSAEPDKILSTPTGELLVTTSCSLISSIEVQKVEDKTFGQGDHKITHTVRPIQIIFKDNWQQILIDKSFELSKAIKEDATLKNYLLSRYELVKKIAIAGVKLSEDYDPNKNYDQEFNKEDYEKGVNKFFDDIVPEDISKSLKESTKEQNEIVKVLNSKTVYYLDQSNLEIVASSAEQTTSLNVADIDGLNDIKTLRELLKDGIYSKTETYDMKYGEKAVKVNTPSKTKSFDTFTEDILGKENADEINELFNSLQPKNNEIGDDLFGTDGSDSLMLPTDGSIPPITQNESLEGLEAL
jgi:hypothetical protein